MIGLKRPVLPLVVRGRQCRDVRGESLAQQSGPVVWVDAQDACGKLLWATWSAGPIADSAFKLSKMSGTGPPSSEFVLSDTIDQRQRA